MAAPETVPSPNSTRGRIRDAALALFLEQGYHGTSMRQIAHRADVSLAAIYNHVVSKEALFVDLLSEYAPQRAMVAALAEARGLSADDLVHDATQRVAAALADQQPNLRLMFIELLEFQGRHGALLAEEILPGAAGFMTRLRESDRRLRPYPAMLIARAFLGLIMSYGITGAFLQDIDLVDFSPEDLTAFGNILLHGILDPVPPRPEGAR